MKINKELKNFEFEFKFIIKKGDYKDIIIQLTKFTWLLEQRNGSK